MRLTKERRVFLHSALVLIGSLMVPTKVLSRWDDNAYNKVDITESFFSIGITNPGNLIEANDVIELSLPEIAENGAIVPITVHSKVMNTERIFVFAEKNPQPLVSDYIITDGVEPFAASRIKMSETAFVHVIVLANGTFYRASRQVKVTIGGCGEE
ncbi:thiosulfate oxidation carrier protein SoxY [Burkholderiales bacterium]|nr:thiosulfate oxidation carrier protein SoxY [Burkholderiales bacterium]